ncbi:MAG: hypothetical protein WA383_01485 [Terriglobales bacterium]|jgi:hypothetical protein
MTKPTKIREIDLKPYQTHFLFQSDSLLTSKGIEKLLKELPKIIDDGLEDEDDRCEILAQGPLRAITKDEQIAWLAYSKRVKVRWAAGPDAPKDIEHHLVVLTARSSFLSVVATDKSLGARLTRGGSGKEWKTLHRVSFSRLERALVSGNTRTLWLSGIHRSVATKADSKVLIGPDVEASLDALGDQSYQYTSTRCAGPKALPASFVGVTPRMAKAWLGPSADWEVFVANSQRLLQLIESPGAKKETPYPVLARAEGSLKDVKDAFDVSLAPPEYLYDEDPDLIAELENLLQQATWTVQAGSGADCILALKLADRVHNFKIEVRAEGGGIQHTVTPSEKEPSPEVEKIAELFGRADLLKVFYDSLHTYSDGQIFEVKTRPFPFPVKDEDFSKFEITLEKPRPAGKTEGLDLSRIGVAGEPSLFTWVWQHYKQGWLWCDDGSGEIADFIHLDPGHSTLSLIHVKAANSSSPNRGISVSAYEVVCSQALKNLRYTERRELEQPLKEKIESADAKIVRGWHNGKALPLKSTALWSAINKVRYSDLTRRVVIVQPHVRKSLLPANLAANTSPARQARLLYTLLHGVKADIDRYGAEFEVVVDK